MNLEPVSHCPVCDHTTHKTALSVNDYTVSNTQFTISQCTNCSFLFTNPRPTAKDIGGYYQSTDYISHHDEAKDLMSRIYIMIRNYTADQKLKLIKRFAPAATNLLDVGCGTGFFLSTAQTKGYLVHGTEPDPDALVTAKNRVGSRIYPTIQDPELTSKRFDVITLWHVLEHIHLLNETLNWLHSHLNPDGKLFIAVPNPESYDATEFSIHWAAYDVPRHLYHFSKSTMVHLLKKHNFHLESIKPMWFDAYYVSLLSTKYKTGQSALIQSVITGTLSNWHGRKKNDTDYNTSSLIYVFSKR